MDDSPSWGAFFGMCFWGNENTLVSFPLLCYRTHSLFSCLDAGVHLCGSSLCQAAGAAWFLGSRAWWESKGSKGVSYHTCLCHRHGRTEKDENTPEMGRDWNEWGRETNERTALEKERPHGAMAKEWQPSDSWVLVEDHWAHPTLGFAKPWETEIRKSRCPNSSPFFSRCWDFRAFPCWKELSALEVLLHSGTAFDVHQTESWWLGADSGLAHWALRAGHERSWPPTAGRCWAFLMFHIFKCFWDFCSKMLPFNFHLISLKLSLELVISLTCVKSILFSAASFSPTVQYI